MSWRLVAPSILIPTTASTPSKRALHRVLTHEEFVSLESLVLLDLFVPMKQDFPHNGGFEQKFKFLLHWVTCVSGNQGLSWFFYILTVSRALTFFFLTDFNDFLRIYSQKNIIKSRIINIFVTIVKIMIVWWVLFIKRKLCSLFHNYFFSHYRFETGLIEFYCIHFVKIFVSCSQAYLHYILSPHLFNTHLFRSSLREWPFLHFYRQNEITESNW